MGLGIHSGLENAMPKVTEMEKNWAYGGESNIHN